MCHLKIRFAKALDQPKIIGLIDQVLHEYDDKICLTGSESDLLDIEKNYFQNRSAFWVIESPHSDSVDENSSIENSSTILGTQAAIEDPHDADVCDFKRIYVHQSLRGSEWSGKLMQTAIDWATEQQFKRIEFWSDTRFHRAHRFFGKFGFLQSGETRSMNDSHLEYREHFFYRNIN